MRGAEVQVLVPCGVHFETFPWLQAALLARPTLWIVFSEQTEQESAVARCCPSPSLGEKPCKAWILTSVAGV